MEPNDRLSLNIVRIMSPHIGGRHIDFVLSVRLSVRLSICLSVRPDLFVRIITLIFLNGI